MPPPRPRPLVDQVAVVIPVVGRPDQFVLPVPVQISGLYPYGQEGLRGLTVLVP